MYSRMSPIAIQWRIQTLSLGKGGGFSAWPDGCFFTEIRWGGGGVNLPVSSPRSATAITHANNTDTKTFMAVQTSILQMEVHV